LLQHCLFRKGADNFRQETKVKYMSQMPKRNIGLCFLLDTNRINARQLDKAMNQLEKWAEDGVIFIYWPKPAADEVMEGGSRNRFKKLLKFGPKMEVLAETPQEQKDLKKISSILFDRMPQNKNETRDVEILFVTKKYAGSLITEDGGSKRQPGGILGKRDQLKSELNIQIYRTEEAFNLVHNRITLRDDKTRYVAEHIGKSLPAWVGKD
jgi:hypothetical protein